VQQRASFCYKLAVPTFKIRHTSPPAYHRTSAHQGRGGKGKGGRGMEGTRRRKEEKKER